MELINDCVLPSANQDSNSGHQVPPRRVHPLSHTVVSMQRGVERQEQNCLGNKISRTSCRGIRSLSREKLRLELSGVERQVQVLELARLHRPEIFQVQRLLRQLKSNVGLRQLVKEA